MTRFRDIAMGAVETAIGMVFGGLILFGLWQGYRMAPAIENWLVPVVRVEGIEPVYRDARLACFDLHLTKLRDGDPLRYEFMARQELSSGIGLSAYVAHPDRTPIIPFNYAPHAVGDQWTRTYCFKMPGAVLPFERLTVVGFGEHRRHPLWTSVTPVPAFDFPPVPGAASPP